MYTKQKSLCVILIMLLLVPSKAFGAQDSYLKLVGPTRVPLGQSFRVDIKIEDIDKLYAFQVKIKFDNNYIEAFNNQFLLSADIAKEPHFIASNHLGDGLGEIVLTLLGKGNVIETNGIIGGFYLRGIKPGKTNVSVETSILLSDDGQEISHRASSLSTIIEKVNGDIREDTIDPDIDYVSIGAKENMQLLRKNISPQDNYIEIGDNLKIFIPTGTFDKDTEICVMTLPALDESFSNVYEITFSNSPSKRIKLSLRSNNLENDKNYGIYHFNEDHEKWIYQGGLLEDGYISAWISHFSRFTVLEDKNYIEFTDIENNWAREYIQFLNSMGIISGLPDKSFNPNGNMTRAEVAKVLSLAMDYGNNEMGDSDVESISFIDCYNIPSWAFDSVSKLYTRGIIGGYQDNSFRPSNYVTRAELASMISRCLREYISTEGDFSYVSFIDDEYIPLWSKNDIYLIRSLGIINGYVDGSFRPNDNISRSEACKIIYEILKVLNVI